MRGDMDAHKGWLWYVSPVRLPHEDKTGPTCKSANMLRSSACSIHATGRRQRQQADAGSRVHAAASSAPSQVASGHTFR
jgi:hypothetical protein